jgi:hypothetical protein
MKLARLLSLAALGAVLVPAAVVHASTVAERESWAKSAPKVVSHGRTSRFVCVDRSVWRDAEGGLERHSGACPAIFEGNRVHEGGNLYVRTPRQASEVLMSVSTLQGTRASTVQPCRRRAAGDFVCRTPARPSSEGEAVARLFVRYPGARTYASLTIAYHGH